MPTGDSTAEDVGGEVVVVFDVVVSPGGEESSLAMMAGVGEHVEVETAPSSVGGVIGSQDAQVINQSHSSTSWTRSWATIAVHCLCNWDLTWSSVEMTGGGGGGGGWAFFFSALVATCTLAAGGGPPLVGAWL